jgi:hypothetical protein
MTSRRLALVTAAVVVMGAATAEAVTPVKVIGRPGNQFEAASNGTYIAWHQNTVARPHRWNAVARRVDGSYVFKLNANGTEGFMGGMLQGTDKMIYQQVNGPSSDLYLFDLGARTRSKVAFANTPDWEWNPRISDTWLLFNRDLPGTKENTVLMKRSTGGSRKLVSVDDTKKLVIPGSVGESFATWTVCGATSCTAYLYRIATKSARAIPTKHDRAQYAPVVDEDAGRVYYARSGAACGSNVTVWRLPVGLSGSPTKIMALPKGIDMDWAASLAPNLSSGKLDLLFSRVECKNGTTDIYAARHVSTA